MLNMIHLPIYKQGIVFFWQDTFSIRILSNPPIFGGLNSFCLLCSIRILTIKNPPFLRGCHDSFGKLFVHPSASGVAFGTATLSKGESLDKEFHRCVKVLLEPDKSLGLEVEDTSKKTHTKKRTIPPGPKGRSSIPFIFFWCGQDSNQSLLSHPKSKKKRHL